VDEDLNDLAQSFDLAFKLVEAARHRDSADAR